MKSQGKKRIQTPISERRSPLPVMKTTTEAERTEAINAQYARISEARAKYFRNVAQARKSVGMGDLYSEAYQEWNKKNTAAAWERDEDKRTQLQKEAAEALELAKKLQANMHNNSMQADAEREMREEIQEAEAAILALGGVLDLNAKKEEPQDG